MAWYEDIDVFGPRRKPLGESSSIPNEGLMWRAKIDVLEEASPNTPKWRHLFLQSDAWNPPGLVASLRLNLPGTSVVRCRVKRLDIRLFDRTYAFSPQGASNTDVTLLVQTLPRDNQGSSQWSVGHAPANTSHYVTDAPILQCVMGEISIGSLAAPVGSDWRNEFSSWTNGSNQAIVRESLAAHASGLAFVGDGTFAWSNAACRARYNVVLPRPSSGIRFPIIVNAVGFASIRQGLNLGNVIPILRGFIQAEGIALDAIPTVVVISTNTEWAISDSQNEITVKVRNGVLEVTRLNSALLIEPDRQWLLSDRPEAITSLSKIRGEFVELNSILRGDSLPERPHWHQLRLSRPDGPPAFHWLIDKRNGTTLSTFVLRRGEMAVELSDQPVGVRDVVPRSVAAIEGEFSFTLTPDLSELQIQLVGHRELKVSLAKEPESEKLSEWIGRLSFVSNQSGDPFIGSLRWSAGRSMTKKEAALLRRDFPDLKDSDLNDPIQSLIELATVNVPISQNVSIDGFPELTNRTEQFQGKLYWYDIGFRSAISATEDDLALRQLRQLSETPGLAAEIKESLKELERRISPSLVYGCTNTNPNFEESFAWNSLETTYNANEVAEFLRDIHDVPPPDPDTVGSTGGDGKYRATPAVLWGTMPLESGWATLPFFNCNDKLYTRILTMEPHETEEALISGVGVWGNDDPRLWHDDEIPPDATDFLSDRQRWSLTLRDADQIEGIWKFGRAPNTWELRESTILFFQPEIILSGFFHLSKNAPTVEDSLPDIASWPNSFRSFSLRTPQTREVFPSPYRIDFTEGSIKRADSPNRLNIKSFATLGSWDFAIEPNLRLVRVPNPVPRLIQSCPLSFHPMVPDRTNHLSLVRRLYWPATRVYLASHKTKLEQWEANGTYQREFKFAVKRLRQLLDEIGLGNQPDKDLSEEFVYSDGVQILNSGASDLPRIQSALIWEGGALDSTSDTLLTAWKNMADVTQELKQAIDALRSRIDSFSEKWQDVFSLMSGHPFWNHAFNDQFPRPLVWRKHPRLPFIQSLPLTQSLSPPSHPSSSRQLAPFELQYDQAPKPQKWFFHCESTNDDDTSRRWPEYKAIDDLVPSVDWTDAGPSSSGFRFLPMVSLSLPGISAHPIDRSDATQFNVAPVPDPTGFALSLQWSFGLPYLSEIFALAQLPRNEGLTDQTTGALRDALSDTDEMGALVGNRKPSPLKRETFAEAWSEMAELAILANVDADAGLEFVTSSSQRVTGLISPYIWNVECSLNNTDFPGTFTFSEVDAGGQDLVLREPIASGAISTPPVPAPQHTALRGIQGSFARIGSNLRLVAFDSGQFDVFAGTMAAAKSASALRDQRGLWRFPSTHNVKWLRTPVQHAGVDTTLTTSLETLRLDMEDFGEWNLWFKDLPIEGSSYLRTRSVTPFSPNEGINDPTADSPGENFKQGYEWKLGSNDGSTQLQIGPLQFFPLTLERVDFVGDDVSSVVITGRLQLKLASSPDSLPRSPEREHESNVVRMTFNSVAGTLQFETLSLVEVDHLLGESNELHWALQDNIGSACIRARNIARAGGQIVLTNITVEFAMLGARWSLETSDSISIAHDATAIDVGLDVVPTNNQPVWMEKALLRLALDSGEHKIAVTLHARLGPENGPHITLEKEFELLIERQATTQAFLIVESQRLKLGGDSKTKSVDMAVPVIQHHWDDFLFSTHMNVPVPVHVLPGFQIKPQDNNPQMATAPGYASVQYSVEISGTGNASGFKKVIGAGEILFSCEWGKALQEAKSNDTSWELTERAFKSSAGTVSVGMVTKSSSQSPGGEASLLLNGMFEVTNLVSWPSSILEGVSPSDQTVTFGNTTNGYSHWRHTARILLNQVDVESTYLEISPTPQPPIPGEDTTLFTFKEPFQIVAVVEHQLAKLAVLSPTMASPVPVVERIETEYRWTATQEVRLLSPNDWGSFLRKFNTNRTIDSTKTDSGILNPIPDVVTGWLRRGFIADLSQPSSLEGMNAGGLIIELSAAFLFARTAASFGSATNDEHTIIQTLPHELDQAVISSLSDFIPASDANPDSAEIDTAVWSHVVLPFFGRLQPSKRDGLVGPQVAVDTSQPSQLCIDPILWLTLPSATRPRYAKDLTSTTDGPLQIGIGGFDRLDEQKWEYVDPVSLETAIHRLSNPPNERSRVKFKLESAMSSAPETGYGRLSRPSAMKNAFDPSLDFYPPGKLAASDFDEPENVEWRYGALLAMHGRYAVGFPDLQRDYGFFLSGFRLGQLLGDRHLDSTMNRVPCLTLLPLRMRLNETGVDPFETKLGQSVAVAASPYLSIRREPLDAPGTNSVPILIFADLVAVRRLDEQEDETLVDEQDRETVAVVASRIFETHFPEDDENADDGLEPLSNSEAADFDTLLIDIESWAKDARRVTANDSRIGIVRLRCVSEEQGSTLPSLQYRFIILKNENHAPVVPSAANRLRAEQGAVRAREGQYSGYISASTFEPIEVAPPQVADALPLYLEKPPSILGASADSEQIRWSWGYSGLKYSLLYTVGGIGISAKVKDDSSPEKMYWMSVSHPTQFMYERIGNATLLPKNYRAAAIRSLLPAPPNVPYPPNDDVKRLSDTFLPADPIETTWQPILPGSQQMKLIGGRAGAFMALRAHLATVDDSTTISGSVPVQHRWPRPIHIPANRQAVPDNTLAQREALAPWGNWFDLENNVDRSVDVRRNPHDSLFLMKDDEAYLLEVELLPLVMGEPAIASDRWSDKMIVKLRIKSTKNAATDIWQLEPAKLKMSLSASAFSAEFTYDPHTPVHQDHTGALIYQFEPTDVTVARNLIFAATHGELLRFELRVKVDDAYPPQTAELPIRRVHSNEIPEPLSPVFCRFEDPEYNRRLSTPSTKSFKQIRLRVGTSNTATVSLALDRREYNPTTVFFVAIQVASDAGLNSTFEVELLKIDPNGIVAKISPSSNKLLVDVNSATSALLDIRFGAGTEVWSGVSLSLKNLLNPGDRLVVRITPTSGLIGDSVECTVQIVADPVSPPPEAAYALLRREENTENAPVGCTRFAWSPTAAKMDLVDPRDLFRDSVRRRAVFVWQDTIRSSRRPQYAIQKILPNGSTLIPKLQNIP